MIDPFDKLIEETREKYKLSWKNSLKEYKKFCKWQNYDFEYAIKYGTFPPKIPVGSIVIEAKPRKLKGNWSLELSEGETYYNEEALKELSSAMNSKHQTKKFNFFQKIYWGWKQVYYNFDEWCWVVSGKNNEFDAPVTLDLFIGLNINLSQILEES
jgi:hypothetical protein